MSNTTTREYRRDITDGKLWAFELKDGWIPTRKLGPIEPAELGGDAETLDFTEAQDASTVNTRNLVRLCDRERELLISGKSRSSTATRSTRPIELPGRRVTDRPASVQEIQDRVAAIAMLRRAAAAP